MVGLILWEKGRYPRYGRLYHLAEIGQGDTNCHNGRTCSANRTTPTVCISPPPPDRDCGQIPHRNFTVLEPDPHGFDRDNNGIGRES